MTTGWDSSRLVVEVSSVGLECGQQCHHLPEDLLVDFCELREPSLEQRVVADLHGMHFTSYEVDCIPGNPFGNPPAVMGSDSAPLAGPRTPPDLVEQHPTTRDGPTGSAYGSEGRRPHGLSFEPPSSFPATAAGGPEDGSCERHEDAEREDPRRDDQPVAGQEPHVGSLRALSPNEVIAWLVVILSLITAAATGAEQVWRPGVRWRLSRDAHTDLMSLAWQLERDLRRTDPSQGTTVDATLDTFATAVEGVIHAYEDDYLTSVAVLSTNPGAGGPPSGGDTPAPAPQPELRPG